MGYRSFGIGFDGVEDVGSATVCVDWKLLEKT
jgi:hypothetical protein